MKIILQKLIFDEDIVESIRKLNDGFDLRKKEIIYHLYYIEKQIPEILGSSPNDYQSIGNKMAIDCSPERSRKTVNSQLRKIVNNISVNCELHTKMKVISSNPPDRIYFCPSLPEETGRDMAGKIYIYKISKHA